jgi:hypothetical protein
VVIRRISGQAGVLDRFFDRKVIETLIVIVPETHYFMDGIIKKTADARASVIVPKK